MCLTGKAGALKMPVSEWPINYGPTLDPDFAADLEEIIKSRKPREISSWE
jgi:hypothetical protein